ncbi:unnamed protein product [Candidula unifasciata]|uniref:LRAT domain-containing protein n=1 Tax=Candidula unifasciata TaxID=100452 RepID=A0A8S3YG53_9EUPU|nr:unnamed protein product [Candidula unifasciata]
MTELSLYYNHNASILDDLSVGDLIEFPRGAYSHWAVYIGNGRVVHLAGEDNDGVDACVKPEHMFTVCGAKFGKAKVCIDDFWKVAAGSKARKNNTKDDKWRPLNPEEVVRNALEKLGTVGYNLIFSNCEHFAKWCRYGIAKSDQVEQVMTGAMVGIATGLTVGLIYAFGKYFNNNEEETQKQKVEKRKNNW